MGERVAVLASVRLFLCFGALALACLTLAQQNRYSGKLLDPPPVIDGNVTDDEWKDVPSSTGGYDEQTGAPDPHGSQYWIAYDKSYIYVAGRFKEPDPKLIQATEYRQNVSLEGNDRFIVAIDPFSTLSDTSQFEVSPRGGTNIRISGGRAAKREWLGEFLAKARVTPEGWEVEARIPWSILRLPPAGPRDLRVTFGRVVNRTGRAYLADDLSGGKSRNFGVWENVDVPAASTRKSLKLLPYAYGGADNDGHIANAGLDFKYPVTSEIDLVGSINPDFRNIENQVLSLDFSYFERLAGESRPFFLEGSNYFQTSQDSPLFASQRIRGFDVGVKAYGKLTENSTIAVLNTHDFGNQNNFVGAFNYNFSKDTNARVAMTDLESDAVTNRASFLSFNHQMGPLSVFGQHMLTSDSAQGDGHRYNTGLVLQQNGLTSVLEYIEISPKFLPRLGFAPERDLKGVNAYGEYNRPVKSGGLMEIGGAVSVNDTVKFDGSKYRRSVDANGSLTWRDGTDFDFGVTYREFQGFVDKYLFLSLEKPRGDPYRHWQFDVVAGDIAGHSYRSISPAINYRPKQNLQLNLRYQRVDHFDVREQTILSGIYDLNASDAISGRAIRTGGDTNFYLAFRRTGNRGNEYFLILGDPNARTFRTSLVLKAVFPIELKF